MPGDLPRSPFEELETREAVEMPGPQPRSPDEARQGIDEADLFGWIPAEAARLQEPFLNRIQPVLGLGGECSSGTRSSPPAVRY
jgi:hypothetical protein